MSKNPFRKLIKGKIKSKKTYDRTTPYTEKEIEEACLIQARRGLTPTDYYLREHNKKYNKGFETEEDVEYRILKQFGKLPTLDTDVIPTDLYQWISYMNERNGHRIDYATVAVDRDFEPTDWHSPTAIGIALDYVTSFVDTRFMIKKDAVSEKDFGGGIMQQVDKFMGRIEYDYSYQKDFTMKKSLEADNEIKQWITEHLSQSMP